MTETALSTNQTGVAPAAKRKGGKRGRDEPTTNFDFDTYDTTSEPKDKVDPFGIFPKHYARLSACVQTAYAVRTIRFNDVSMFHVTEVTWNEHAKHLLQRLVVLSQSEAPIHDTTFNVDLATLIICELGKAMGCWCFSYMDTERSKQVAKRQTGTLRMSGTEKKKDKPCKTKTSWFSTFIDSCVAIIWPSGPQLSLCRTMRARMHPIMEELVSRTTPGYHWDRQQQLVLRTAAYTPPRGGNMGNVHQDEMINALAEED